MFRQTAFTLSLLAAAICPVVALAAAQSIRIGPSGAIIYAGPNSSSKMTGSLRAGQVVVISEPPRAGYYHVAMKRRYLGWVQEAALDLPRPPGEEVVQQSRPAAPVYTPPERHEPPTSYVGVFFGAGFAGGGTSLGLGADGGYKLSPLWGLGLYFQYLSLSSAAAAASAATPASAGSTSLTSSSSGGASLLVAAVELNYYLVPLPGAFIGIKGGMAIATANASTTPTSTTTSASTATTATTAANTSSFAAGGALAVGYDYPIISTLSAGAEINYFFITGDIATKITNVMGTIRFIF